MLGYKKTIKLWLVEFLVGLLIHVVYAFNETNIDTARYVLVISIVSVSLASLFALTIKNENIAMLCLMVVLVLATTSIGYLLNTLGLSVFVYIITALMATFSAPMIILCYGIASTGILFAYSFVFEENILHTIPTMPLFNALVILYAFSIGNMYAISYFLNKYVEETRLKTAEAESASESKMVFLSNMSHEIRTPMNAIYGMAELSLRDESISTSVRDNVENIKKASGVLISIVNDILDYSKMESGNIDIIPVTYSFRKLCNDVVNIMRIRMEDKEVQIKTEIEDDLPDILIGDEIRIRQIIFNLLSNAVKNTDKGYIILRVKGETENKYLTLRVSVIDSGIGIKKEDLPKLFNSFQKIDSRNYTANNGAGIGLAIVKKLLDTMGGTIDVESTYGVGSNFTFTLSQQISEDKAFIQYSSDSVKKNNVTRIVAPEAKVLVVDDNKVNLKVAKGLLKTFEMTVDTCNSGRECLEILKINKDYDIIFLDHMMPELDGLDTLNLIRLEQNEYMQKVPVVVLTANVATGVREMFLAEGFDEYVAKPIDMIWLNSVLCKLLPKDKQR